MEHGRARARHRRRPWSGPWPSWPSLPSPALPGQVPTVGAALEAPSQPGPSELPLVVTLSLVRIAQVLGPAHRSSGMPSLRALVCDDYSMVRETIRPPLVEPGFETIREATLATEAISLAEMTQPDVIVLDLSLPGMSGLQAIPILRLVSPRSAVVVFSAYDIWRDACVDAGASAYVDKGDLQDLDEVLRRVATKSPLGRINP